MRGWMMCEVHSTISSSRSMIPRIRRNGLRNKKCGTTILHIAGWWRFGTTPIRRCRATAAQFFSHSPRRESRDGRLHDHGRSGFGARHHLVARRRAIPALRFCPTKFIEKNGVSGNCLRLKLRDCSPNKKEESLVVRFRNPPNVNSFAAEFS